MKFAITILMLLISNLAYAASSDEGLSKVEDDVAIVKVRVENLHEPASAPLVLSVSLLCKDRRTHKTAEKPKPRSIYVLSTVCYVGETELIAHLLTLNYSLSEVNKKGLSECSNDQQKPYDLSLMCERWQP